MIRQTMSSFIGIDGVHVEGILTNTESDNEDFSITVVNKTELYIFYTY